MKYTLYFTEQVLRKRNYLKIEWCELIVKNPIKTEVQEDGRIRYWGKVTELDDKIVRVVTLADGVTLHNAFLDRNFKIREEEKQ